MNSGGPSGIDEFRRGAEYRLLEFLMSHPGITFNQTQLLTQVWGGDTTRCSTSKCLFCKQMFFPE